MSDVLERRQVPIHLAASPLLMLGQMVLVPAVLLAVAGPGAVSLVPFVRAFLIFVALPLTLAVLTQERAGRSCSPG